MRRFAFSKNIRIEKTHTYDVVIIGSGLAGLYTALNLDEELSCLIITKEDVDISNSWLAQGGIAAAVAPGDRPRFHMEDTLTAGAGLCDKRAVQVLVDEGPEDIRRLVELRVPFDLNEDGDLQITREGGHRRNRVVHAHGDATGRETVKTLAAIVAGKPNITFMPHTFFLDILTDEAGVTGAVIYHNGYQTIHCGAIVICTGGIGQIYIHTTNPSVATADGVAAAARAGAVLQNMEFIQFHPTGLYSRQRQECTFLISEALRGEGAQLKNAAGERFMTGVHPMGELAPRDIVARGIVSEMDKSGADHMFLDIRFESEEHLSARFPTIFGECLRRGINISKDLIPVCPVQHYMMGGIATDTNGMTNIPGLYACGEAAHTGVHGANRLASNSMLECLVFGRRSAQNISRIGRRSVKQAVFPDIPERQSCGLCPNEVKERIRAIMSRDGWVVRTKAGLTSGLSEIEEILLGFELVRLDSKGLVEAYNMALVSRQILTAALARKESVGGHYRLD